MEFLRNIWWLKIIAKILISRIPFSYRAFASINIFRWGKMDNVAYAQEVFFSHMEHLGDITDKTILEFGPGDSLACAIFGYAAGAKKIYLVDVKFFASDNVAFYKSIIDYMISVGKPVRDLQHKYQNWDSLATILKDCNAHYLTNGVESLKTIDDSCVDIFISQAVLEHVRYADFETLCNEQARIATPQALASHVVDYRDHLNGGLNNLRFSHDFWAQDWFAYRSGFYTNRLRVSEMAAYFTQTGFKIQNIIKQHYPQQVLEKSKMAPEFRNLSDDDLLTWDAHFILSR